MRASALGGSPLECEASGQGGARTARRLRVLFGVWAARGTSAAGHGHAEHGHVKPDASGWRSRRLRAPPWGTTGARCGGGDGGALGLHASGRGRPGRDVSRETHQSGTGTRSCTKSTAPVSPASPSSRRLSVRLAGKPIQSETESRCLAGKPDQPRIERPPCRQAAEIGDRACRLAGKEVPSDMRSPCSGVFWLKAAQLRPSRHATVRPRTA
jgi:hypothetical protein